jgi:hypothetical protein
MGKDTFDVVQKVEKVSGAFNEQDLNQSLESGYIEKCFAGLYDSLCTS